MKRIINDERFFLKSTNVVDVLVEGQAVLLSVPEWTHLPELAMLFNNESFAEQVAEMITGVHGVPCHVVEYRPQEGYFVINGGVLGVWMKAGRWTGFDADINPDPLFDVGPNDFALWHRRKDAEQALSAMLADPQFRSKVENGLGLFDFRVEHVAEIYGCDPALWEWETQTPDLPIREGENNDTDLD